MATSIHVQQKLRAWHRWSVATSLEQIHSFDHWLQQLHSFGVADSHVTHVRQLQTLTEVAVLSRCHIKMTPPWKIRPRKNNHKIYVSPFIKISPPP